MYVYLEVVVTGIDVVVVAYPSVEVVKLAFRQPVADESENVGSWLFETDADVLSNNRKLPRESMTSLVWDWRTGLSMCCGDFCQVVTPGPVLGNKSHSIIFTTELYGVN